MLPEEYGGEAGTVKELASKFLEYFYPGIALLKMISRIWVGWVCKFVRKLPLSTNVLIVQNQPTWI